MYRFANSMLRSVFEYMYIQTPDVHNNSTRQADLLYVQYDFAKRSQRRIKNMV